MEPEDIKALMVCGGEGAICGAIVAVIFRRAQHPYAATALWSFVSATLLALACVAVAGAVYSTRRFGFNPGRAILAAISTAFFLMFSAPIFCGIPAMLTGMATQGVLQLFLRWNRTAPPR